MYCDSDDGFCNTFGIKIIFENIDLCEKEKKLFDILSIQFYSEKQADEEKPWSLSICNHNNIYIQICLKVSEGGKRLLISHQVKAGIAEGRDRVKHRVINAFCDSKHRYKSKSQ